MEQDRKNKLDARSTGERLYDFICDRNLEDAKLLAADPNCDPNWVSDAKEMTPLIKASHRGYFDVVKILLKPTNTIQVSLKSGQSTLFSVV